MKQYLYLINAAIYALLLYLHGHFSAKADALEAAFQRLGWQAYNGPDLDSPDNLYYGLWIGCSLGSAILAIASIGGRSETEQKTLSQLWLYLSLFFACCSVMAWLTDGSFSLKESQFLVTGAAIVQVIVSLVLFSKKLWVERVDLVLKYLFLVQALVFLGALALGVFFWQWDVAILERISSVRAEGGTIYDDQGMYLEGFNHRLPENIYHAILMGISLLCLLVTALAKQANRFKNVYRTCLIVLLLYSAFVYANNGHMDMGETLPFWGGQIVYLTALSFYLFIKTEDKLPDPTPSNPDILDDWTP